MKSLRGMLLVGRHAFGQALRGRRGLGLFALAAIPCLFLALMSDTRTETHHFLVLVLVGYFRFVIPFAGLFLGVGVLGAEVENRTITYLYTRPLPRPVFFLGRLLGYVGSFGILVVVSMYVVATALADDIGLSTEQVARTLLTGLLGLAAYTAFVAALRVFFDKALYIGFFLMAILEWALTSLPASGLSKCSIWHHLAVLEVRLFTGSETRPISELLQGIAADETAGASATTLLVVLVVCALVGALAVRYREVRVPAAVA